MRFFLSSIFSTLLVLPLLACSPLPASGPTPDMAKTDAFRKAARVLFSNEGLAPDPHLFLAASRLQPLLTQVFGRETAMRWTRDSVAGLCRYPCPGGWIGRQVIKPYLPALPTCGPQPDLHANAQLLLALCAGGRNASLLGGPQEEGLTRMGVTNWLQRHIAIDTQSPGIETEALLRAGVTPDDAWTTAGGSRWSTRRLLDAAIVTWRRHLSAQRLQRGQALPDRLLHLAPALTAMLERYPAMRPYYAPVLEEVFSVYRDALHADGYWGFPGETFCTGHIIEQYIRARRAGLVETMPFSRPLALMLRHQAPSGWFDIRNNRFAGAHAHGLMALGAALMHPGIITPAERTP